MTCLRSSKNDNLKSIRIIAPGYKDLFRVPDGGKMQVNEKVYTVEYLDETHFNLIYASGRRECFHIHEFAELVAKHGHVVVTIDTTQKVQV